MQSNERGGERVWGAKSGERMGDDKRLRAAEGGCRPLWPFVCPLTTDQSVLGSKHFSGLFLPQLSMPAHTRCNRTFKSIACWHDIQEHLRYSLLA